MDDEYLSADVPISVLGSSYMAYLSGISEGKKVLEIGSREVSCKSTARETFADYTGFDYYPGSNVDVVGDAHKLSEYFGQEFDIVYSAVVFEHLAMPWIVAIEISKVLKAGGIVFIATHFSFSAHERPWNFFQFSDLGLKALFTPLGFECIEAGMTEPIVGRFSSLAQLEGPVVGLYCFSTYLGRKVRDIPNFTWEGVTLEDVVGDTRYPVQDAAN